MIHPVDLLRMTGKELRKIVHDETRSQADKLCAVEEIERRAAKRKLRKHNLKVMRKDDL